MSAVQDPVGSPTSFDAERRMAFDELLKIAANENIDPDHRIEAAATVLNTTAPASDQDVALRIVGDQVAAHVLDVLEGPLEQLGVKLSG